MTARRDGERGLSIMEAIVIATITALLALIVMPLLPRVSAGSFAVAERGVDALGQMTAERDFRTLIRGVAVRAIDGVPQPVVEGSATSIMLRPNLDLAASCASAGTPDVRLGVEQNALICLSEGRRRTLVQWRGESVGSLSYSADGVSWVANWNAAEVAPYVRFQIRRGARVQTSWVERVAGELS